VCVYVRARVRACFVVERHACETAPGCMLHTHCNISSRVSRHEAPQVSAFRLQDSSTHAAGLGAGMGTGQECHLNPTVGRLEVRKQISHSALNRFERVFHIRIGVGVMEPPATL
jgi:hypothetical protein